MLQVLLDYPLADPEAAVEIAGDEASAHVSFQPNPAYNTGRQAPYAGRLEARPRRARDRIYGNTSTPAARAAFARS